MEKESAVSILKHVLKIEKDGLSQLLDHIESNKERAHVFESAIMALLKTKGKTIVTGMGKSGHIGKKIAATLSSTGQPSLFVHPGEASHGDLGVIADQDILILLSNSGETKELSDILHYSKRHNIQTIAISSASNSTLNRLSTYSLTIPKAEEACPMGLAPTTSTTLMMVLGDAIAITLLKWRGFTQKDFHKFHPGGKLGAQLQSVADVMHTKKLPLALSDTPMTECLIQMTHCGFGCVGIINDEKNLIGIITDGDLRRHIHANILSKKAIDVMTKKPKTAHPSMLMVDALNEMQQFSITSIFVVENEKPVGLLHIHDFLRQGVL
ncbi:MAG: Arabinose 5-phosphate isomerase KdsD [Holosporales bacterium]